MYKYIFNYTLTYNYLDLTITWNIKQYNRNNDIDQISKFKVFFKLNRGTHLADNTAFFVILNRILFLPNPIYSTEFTLFFFECVPFYDNSYRRSFLQYRTKISFGMIFFNDYPDRYVIIGSIVIVISTYYIIYRETKLGKKINRLKINQRHIWKN